MNYNKVILAGRLTRDPEVKYTPKGTAVAKAALAINRSWKAEGGERKDEATFVDISVWGDRGKAFAEHCKKGKCVMVEGRLHVREWKGENGEKRRASEVVVDQFYFVERKESEGVGPGKDTPNQTSPQSPQSPQEVPAKDSGDSDDVPF